MNRSDMKDLQATRAWTVPQAPAVVPAVARERGISTPRPSGSINFNDFLKIVGPPAVKAHRHPATPTEQAEQSSRALTEQAKRTLQQSRALTPPEAPLAFAQPVQAHAVINSRVVAEPLPRSASPARKTHTNNTCQSAIAQASSTGGSVSHIQLARDSSPIVSRTSYQASSSGVCASHIQHARDPSPIVSRPSPELRAGIRTPPVANAVVRMQSSPVTRREEYLPTTPPPHTARLMRPMQPLANSRSEEYLGHTLMASGAGLPPSHSQPHLFTNSVVRQVSAPPANCVARQVSAAPQIEEQRAGPAVGAVTVGVAIAVNHAPRPNGVQADHRPETVLRKNAAHREVSAPPAFWPPDDMMEKILASPNVKSQSRATREAFAGERVAVRPLPVPAQGQAVPTATQKMASAPGQAMPTARSPSARPSDPPSPDVQLARRQHMPLVQQTNVNVTPALPSSPRLKAVSRTPPSTSPRMCAGVNGRQAALPGMQTRTANQSASPKVLARPTGSPISVGSPRDLTSNMMMKLPSWPTMRRSESPALSTVVRRTLSNQAQPPLGWVTASPRQTVAQWPSAQTQAQTLAPPRRRIDQAQELKPAPQPIPHKGAHCFPHVSSEELSELNEGVEVERRSFDVHGLEDKLATPRLSSRTLAGTAQTMPYRSNATAKMTSTHRGALPVRQIGLIDNYASMTDVLKAAEKREQNKHLAGLRIENDKSRFGPPLERGRTSNPVRRNRKPIQL